MNLIKFAFIAFSLLLIYPVLASAAPVSDNNLVAYWSFNEGTGTIAADSSRNGNNISLINNPVWVNGINGKALQFDGISNYATRTLATGIPNNQSFSVELWANVNSFSPRSRDFFRLDGSWAVQADPYGRLNLEITGKQDMVSNITIPTNVWTHLAVTSDGTTVKFYRDGILQDTMNQTNIPNTGSNSIYIGGYTIWSTFINATLDEIKIYNRSLNDDEINADYLNTNNPTTIPVPTPSPAPTPTPTPTLTPTPTSTPSSTTIGADANPTGSPIGGGTGYKNIIAPSQATYIVNTQSGLLNALASAISGQIVYVSDGAQIDMTGQSNIVIPAGVTLASGRGNSGSSGALLYTTSYPYPLFKAGGPGVRITGLRIQGADQTQDTPGNYIYTSGIEASFDSLEIDNNEIFGWEYAGVNLLAGATNAYIHHNYIHHNQNIDLGYGIVLGDATQSQPIDALIEANLFDYNKHSIAATGSSGSSYEARYNIVGANDVYHDFDRHGTIGGTGGYAGDWTLIHHNTFKKIGWYVVAIRGVPYKGAQIYNNWFYQTQTTPLSEGTIAIALWNYNGNRLWENNLCSTYPVGCLSTVTINNNWYGTTPPP